jgi:hypothetical protein
MAAENLGEQFDSPRTEVELACGVEVPGGAHDSAECGGQ